MSSLLVVSLLSAGNKDKRGRVVIIEVLHLQTGKTRSLVTSFNFVPSFLHSRLEPLPLSHNNVKTGLLLCHICVLYTRIMDFIFFAKQQRHREAQGWTRPSLPLYFLK